MSENCVSSFGFTFNDILIGSGYQTWIKSIPFHFFSHSLSLCRTIFYSERMLFCGANRFTFQLDSHTQFFFGSALNPMQKKEFSLHVYTIQYSKAAHLTDKCFCCCHLYARWMRSMKLPNCTFQTMAHTNTNCLQSIQIESLWLLFFHFLFWFYFGYMRKHLMLQKHIQ